MSKKIEVLKVAQKILELKNQALSPNKMYHIADELGLTKDLNLKGKTPWASFASYIYVDLKTNPKTPFEKVQNKPVLIKLKGQKISPNEPSKTAKSSFLEKDMHEALVAYTFSSPKFNAYCKTIYHQKSQKSKPGIDKWIHPDIVGVSFDYANYSDSVINFMKKFNKIPLSLYSFELKREINAAKLREYYFQAVSNSSWANEGYLVAGEFDESDDELMELAKKLNASFGIGIIKLDIDEPSQSEVLFLAAHKESLDFVMIDELSRKNEDFKSFIKTAYEFEPKNSHRYDKDFDSIKDI